MSIEIADSISDPDPNNFRLVVHYGQATTVNKVTYPAPAVESFDPITFQGSPSSAPYGRDIVNNRSEYIVITDDFNARPNPTPTAQDARGRPLAQPISLANGNDGPPPTSDDFIGQPAQDSTVAGTGLYALDKVTDVDLIAIPGQGDVDTINAGMNYCKLERKLQDCFFIADLGSLDIKNARNDSAQPDVATFQAARDFAVSTTAPLARSSGDYGALYFPWVFAADPIGRGRNPRILLPPSGFMAGIYARIDNTRGVFKAPAGTEAGVAGALSTATIVDDSEQDELNPVSVNVIRTVPGSGIVVWGTRTLSSDSSWRYVPVRRMAIFLRVSIYYGIQWAVFEPNDEPLWASLRFNIRAFMLTQFRAGAFQGSTPDEAFFVKCDSTTTTQQDIDNGVVNILVGFAPLKPAEFVVLKLSQKVNQPAE